MPKVKSGHVQFPASRAADRERIQDAQRRLARCISAAITQKFAKDALKDSLTLQGS
jgi:hypothetical protein